VKGFIKDTYRLNERPFSQTIGEVLKELDMFSMYDTACSSGVFHKLTFSFWVMDGFDSSWHGKNG
jgi:hypothetical protein